MGELRRFITSFEFASPLHFWIGSAVVLLLIFLPLLRKRRGLALDLAHWHRRVEFKSKRVGVFSILVAITSALLAAALANPQTVTKESILIYGKPVMAIIDVSGSMDYAGSPGEERSSGLEKAREVFDYVLSRAVGANFGLLLYSTENYIARYFVYKDELLRDTLEIDKDIAFISTGTRTAQALARARRFFENVEVKDKAILLISDLEGDIEALIETTEEMEADLWAGIKLYVIVMREGQSSVDRGPRRSEIKEVEWVGMNDKYGIDRVCQEMAAMDSSPILEEEILLRKSRVSLLIPPILGLIALCLVLSETRFRKIP